MCLDRKDLKEEEQGFGEGEGSVGAFQVEDSLCKPPTAGEMMEHWKNRKKYSVVSAQSMAGNEDGDTSNGETTWDLIGMGTPGFLV